MKKLFYILIAFAAMACCASCGKENPEVTPAKKLTVVSSNLAFESTGGSGTIVVESEEAVTASSDKDWAQVSVSGKTITVTCGAWTKLESRNARITVKAGNEAQSVTAIQRGAVFSLDSIELSNDILVTSKGSTYTMPFSSNTPVDGAFSDVDWLTVICDNAAGNMTLTALDNPGPGTRHGHITIKLGDTRLTYSLAQYPPFVETKDWSMVFVDNTETATKLQAKVAADHGYFAAECLSDADFAAAKLEAPVFVEQVLVPAITKDIKSSIAEYNGKYGWTSFLFNKTTTLNRDRLTDGDYVGFMVGFDKDGYPSGYYSKSDFYVGKTDVPLTPYQKWIGSWKLSGKNIEGAAYEETVQIMADPDDVDESGAAKETSLIVRGLCSKNQEGAGVTINSGYGDMYLSYDKETQTVTFTGQNGTKKFTHSDRGENCSLQLISMYVKAGATAYTNVTGGSFMALTMNADEKTTKITILDRSAGLPYKAFRMRLLNAGGSAYTIGGNAATISLDGLTFTKQ